MENRRRCASFSLNIRAVSQSFGQGLHCRLAPDPSDPIAWVRHPSSSKASKARSPTISDHQMTGLRRQEPADFAATGKVCI
jgi:hypothetical protein